MSIEKKSLISTLKTTKKANAVSSEVAKPTNVASKRNVLKRMQLRRASGDLKRNSGVVRRAATDLRRASGDLKRAAIQQPKSVTTHRK